MNAKNSTPSPRGGVKAARRKPKKYAETDLGNALRLLDMFGHQARFVPGVGWLTWEGKRWSGKVPIQDLVRRVVRTITSLKWRRKCESAFRVGQVVRTAETMSEFRAEAADFDAEPMLLNLQNGVLDLTSGRLLPHDPRHKVRCIAAVKFDANATCPTFEKFVEEITDGRVALSDYLRRLAGYSLTGLTSEQNIWIFLGRGANGKSVYLNVQNALLGDYGGALDPRLLIVSSGERHPTGLAALKGLRLAQASELNPDERFDESQLKRITGQDVLKARYMNKDFFEFRSTAKLVLALNGLPEVRGADHGIWRRFRIVPFDRIFLPAQQDPHLAEKLKAELPGILNWALSGLRDYLRRHRLDEPPEVQTAVAEFRAESDTVGGFIASCTLAVAGQAVTVAEAHNEYLSYCGANGYSGLGTRQFCQAMATHGHKTAKVRHGGVRGYPGMMLGTTPAGWIPGGLGVGAAATGVQSSSVPGGVAPVARGPSGGAGGATGGLPQAASGAPNSSSTSLKSAPPAPPKV